MKLRDSELEAVAGRFPIGKSVRFFPIRGEAGNVAGVIRSEPWRLGHGAIVIKITGRAGGVCVTHLEPAP